jgi:hypothetical protein
MGKDIQNDPNGIVKKCRDLVVKWKALMPAKDEKAEKDVPIDEKNDEDAQMHASAKDVDRAAIFESSEAQVVSEKSPKKSPSKQSPVKESSPVKGPSPVRESSPEATKLDSPKKVEAPNTNEAVAMEEEQ